MMELEDQERREIIVRQKENMIRHIAAAPGTPAQRLRALIKILLISPTARLADSRNQDADELIADHAHDLEKDQRRLYNERIRALIEEVDRDMYGPRDAPSQLTGEPAHMRVPTGSCDLLRAPSLPSVPTGSGDLLRPPSLPSVPTGFGDLLGPPSPQQPFQNLLFTRAEVEQLDDELLNFEMLLRNVHVYRSKNSKEKIRLILQYQ